MLNPLDIELTINSDRAVIEYSESRGKVSVDLLDLVKDAGEILTVEQMNTLYEKLDEATCLARRLWRSIRSAQTTD